MRSPMSCGIRPDRLTRRFVALLSLGLVVAALGCGEDVQSPTPPKSQPALVSTAATALAFSQVSAGEDHTCGVTADNFAYCWGRNEEGQLGDGSTTIRRTPVAVAGGLRFRRVSAGFSSTCGVTTANRAYCWGANFRGELGDGSTTGRLTPVPVAGGRRFRQVDIKFEHACGVSYPDDLGYCWGDNSHGELGDGTTNNHLTPVAVLRALRFREVSSGFNHTCGLTADSFLFCWGYNRSGQVGDGSKPWIRLKPSLVAGTRRYRQVEAGRDYTCAATNGYRAFCWGDNLFGKLGNGSTSPSRSPKAVAGGLNFERVTTGAFHACGETTSNRAYCWGSNGNGDLGDGTRIDRLTPVAVTGGLFFSQLSAGGFHTCGRTPGAVAYCWGDDFYGQLGDGADVDQLRPVAVAGAM
jgi:alpha-tubulin suppressor-like RCC1 family protein